MNENTHLHRQIHPTWVQNNIISSLAFLEEKNIASLAFTPSESDNKKLSVYNGDKFTAEESFIHYTEKLESTGVLSITLAEVRSINDLNVEEDNNPFNGHVIIDYTAVSNTTQIKKKAKQLKNLAVARAWTYKK
jgi:ssRNA-specific RNase YbeY (16S rRNA maturation enzyme)